MAWADAPPPVPPASLTVKRRNALAGWGLGLGITAMVLNFLFIPGALAIIFGSVGLSRSAQRGVGRRLSLWAIWLGAVGSILALVRILQEAAAYF